jgi:hypothetical protein
VIASIFIGSLSYSKIENRFRNISEGKTVYLKTSLTAAILTFVIPISFFTSMDWGYKHRYLGLLKTIKQPAYGGSLDPKCIRDSEMGPPCIYKSIGANKTVLLIGDSHAGHISQALVDASKFQNWNAVVWTHNGCQVQFNQKVKGKVSENCININIQMKGWVAQHKPDAIIVSQFIHFDSPQDNLRDAIQTLYSIVPNILLIQNNPIFPDEMDFMVERPLVMPRYIPPKTYSTGEMELKDLNASNKLAKWASENRISTIDLSSLFCSKNYCTRYSAAGWLYRDNNHFSVAGAELVIPYLEAFLNKL